MNTQSHAVLTLFILRSGFRRKIPTIPRANAWIVWGALLPDLPMFLFFLWYTFVVPTEPETLWKSLYFRSDWQRAFNLFNSIPLLAAGLWAAARYRKWGGTLFFSAGLVHVAEDFFLHHDDGHAHFFPFSDWSFRSPVSYWDPAYYGGAVALLEVGAVLGASVWIYPSLKSWWSRGLLILANLTNLGNHVVWQTLIPG